VIRHGVETEYQLAAKHNPKLCVKLLLGAIIKFVGDKKRPQFIKEAIALYKKLTKGRNLEEVIRKLYETVASQMKGRMRGGFSKYMLLAFILLLILDKVMSTPLLGAPIRVGVPRVEPIYGTNAEQDAVQTFQPEHLEQFVSVIHNTEHQALLGIFLTKATVIKRAEDFSKQFQEQNFALASQIPNFITDFQPFMNDIASNYCGNSVNRLYSDIGSYRRDVVKFSTSISKYFGTEVSDEINDGLAHVDNVQKNGIQLSQSTLCEYITKNGKLPLYLASVEAMYIEDQIQKDNLLEEPKVDNKTPADDKPPADDKQIEEIKKDMTSWVIKFLCGTGVFGVLAYLYLNRSKPRPTASVSDPDDEYFSGDAFLKLLKDREAAVKKGNPWGPGSKPNIVQASAEWETEANHRAKLEKAKETRNNRLKMGSPSKRQSGINTSTHYKKFGF
jgi:hypothetical protein